MDPGKEEQEKDEKRDFSHGLLAHLEWLELRARRAAVQQEQRERRHERRQFLLSKIRHLRQRRRQLREKLQQAGKPGVPQDPDPPEPREVLQWKIRSCRDLLRVFRLTGISGNFSHPGISFSFHTSFEGSFLDSFRLEVSEFPDFRIRRHSIPPFIPLQLLARRFLPRQLREFLVLLFQHLNAFVARREQLRQLREEFSEFIQGIPSHNSLFNLLSFRYRIPGKIPRQFPEFRARLRYRDPLRSLPSDVTVTTPEGSAAPPEHSELFRSLSLAGAFRALRNLPESPAGIG